ncbi:MAG: hypothetical protein ABSE07_02375 [Methanoregula sp.]
MKTSLVILAMCITVLAMLIAGCTSSQQGGAVPPVSPSVATTTATSFTCGFTNCHGLDLACGPNPPQVCPMYYQLGDKCRQYAYCSNTSGSCSLVTTQQFASCKSCIERCGGADPAEILSCEEKC